MRERIISAGIKIWEVAAALGYTDSTFSRKLRFDFSKTETKKVLEAIEALKAKKHNK